MKSFDDYLNEFKALHGFKTDKKLGEHFGLKSASVSNARILGIWSDENCDRIAEELGVEPMLVQLARDAVRGPEKKRAQIQAFLAKHVATWATVAILTGGSVLTVAPLPAKALTFTENSVNGITPEATQVYDFICKTGSKDYRKYRILFFIRRLMRGLIDFLGTVSRFFTPKPTLNFR